MFGKSERHQIDAGPKGPDPKSSAPKTPDPKSSAPEEARDTSAAAPAGRVQHSILSADTKLTGDLVSSGDVTVEGTIEGSVTCRSLTLCGQPTIKGSVTAETAHVSGAFNGELRAKKVILSKSARMTGDIYQDVLEMHAGAHFEGKVARLSAAPSGASEAASAKHTETAKPKIQTSFAIKTSIGTSHGNDDGRDPAEESKSGEMLLS